MGPSLTHENMPNEIIKSWEKNASEWVEVIDSKRIASRKFTNPAIVEVLKDTPSQRILDIGCGEGWLTRSITALGKQGVGIDAIAQLLENARQKGPESFYQMGYEDIVKGQTVPEAPYDIIVFNFSLYQKEGIPELFEAIKRALRRNGSIVIQTLHPYFLLNNELQYKSQNISDSWKGLPGHFKDGHQWYARTVEDWFSVFAECSMQVIDLRETTDDAGMPVSLILKAI